MNLNNMGDEKILCIYGVTETTSCQDDGEDVAFKIADLPENYGVLLFIPIKKR